MQKIPRMAFQTARSYLAKARDECIRGWLPGVFTTLPWFTIRNESEMACVERRSQKDENGVVFVRRHLEWIARCNGAACAVVITYWAIIDGTGLNASKPLWLCWGLTWRRQLQPPVLEIGEAQASCHYTYSWLETRERSLFMGIVSR